MKNISNDSLLKEFETLVVKEIFSIEIYNWDIVRLHFVFALLVLNPSCDSNLGFKSSSWSIQIKSFRKIDFQLEETNLKGHLIKHLMKLFSHFVIFLNDKLVCFEVVCSNSIRITLNFKPFWDRCYGDKKVSLMKKYMFDDFYPNNLINTLNFFSSKYHWILDLLDEKYFLNYTYSLTISMF